MANYNPFREMDEFEKNFFADPFSMFDTGAIAEFKTDITDNGDSYLLEADLPGFDKKDIKLDINGDWLTINAERHSEHEEKDKKDKYICCERSYGSYSRRFNVSGVKTDESLLGDYRSFRDLVRNERGRELAFEGLRKWDLIRWGTFVEKMHNAGTNQPTENKYRNVSYTNYASANYANVTARHIYLPIPTKELAVNHALRQNPLW